MILLDSDHCTVLFDERHRQHGLLVTRLNESAQHIGLLIVAVEEQLRGFLAYLRKTPDFSKQVWPYLRLAHLLRALTQLPLADYTSEAAALTTRLKKQGIKVGTQDLKIAAIAIQTDALLLSANLRDFQQVPDLQVENWLL